MFKSRSITFSVLTVFSMVLTVFGQNSSSTNQASTPICSVSEPSSSQVCVSIKFPWTANPVFFCTDQGNINYNPQCTDPNQSHHCYDDGRVDTLKIATPWDCCPIISTPNRCSNVECPPVPFNRTCKIIKILGDCCPTYFCDSGEPDNCKTSRLKTSCIHPPKHMENCTVFRDPYGCCNKFQCSEDRKLGSCPSKKGGGVRQGKRSSSMLDYLMNEILSGAKETMSKITTGVKRTLENHGGQVGRAISNVIPDPFGPKFIPPSEILRCTGDYTCPGSMKCCRPAPLGYTVSHRRVHRQRSNGVTKATMQSIKAEYRPVQDPSLPIDGICVEPDSEGSIYSSSPAYDQSTSTLSSTETAGRDEPSSSSTITPSTTHSTSSSKSTQRPITITSFPSTDPTIRKIPDPPTYPTTVQPSSPTTTEQMNPTPITSSAPDVPPSSIAPAGADRKPNSKATSGDDFKDTVVEE